MILHGFVWRHDIMLIVVVVRAGSARFSVRRSDTHVVGLDVVERDNVVERVAAPVSRLFWVAS